MRLVKRIIAFLLVLVFALPLVACNGADGKHFTGEEIIEAYESAGYIVNTHTTFIEGSVCTISAYESREGYNEGNDYIHLVVFENEEYAKEYIDEIQFNLATWLVFAMCGEPRWLHTERYGNVCVEYYPHSFMKPFNDIINTK